MLSRIGTPGSPLVGSAKELTGRPPASFQISQRAHETDVGGRKGIGLAQLPQGDVVRGPFANPAYGLQPLDRLLEPAAGAEEIGIGDAAAATADSVAARLLGMPRADRSARAKTSGRGNTRVKPPSGSARGSP